MKNARTTKSVGYAPAIGATIEESPWDRAKLSAKSPTPVSNAAASILRSAYGLRDSLSETLRIFIMKRTNGKVRNVI